MAKFITKTARIFIHILHDRYHHTYRIHSYLWFWISAMATILVSFAHFSWKASEERECWLSLALLSRIITIELEEKVAVIAILFLLGALLGRRLPASCFLYHCTFSEYAKEKSFRWFQHTLIRDTQVSHGSNGGVLKFQPDLAVLIYMFHRSRCNNGKCHIFIYSAKVVCISHG